mmetsp:Transcript_11063/g.19818  ORF Transcript_11063/g.19818 Transcript_11063/m.19818 type:complete len:370 (-) Transcript_11063:508-1617(-)
MANRALLCMAFCFVLLHLLVGLSFSVGYVERYTSIQEATPIRMLFHHPQLSPVVSPSPSGSNDLRSTEAAMVNQCPNLTLGLDQYTNRLARSLQWLHTLESVETRAHPALHHASVRCNRSNGGTGMPPPIPVHNVLPFDHMLLAPVCLRRYVLVYFVRHAFSIGNVWAVAPKAALPATLPPKRDVELSSQAKCKNFSMPIEWCYGEDQPRVVGCKLSKKVIQDLDLVITSPLRRALQTSMILLPEYHGTIEVNELCSEIAFGQDSFGQPLSDIVRYCKALNSSDRLLDFHRLEAYGERPWWDQTPQLGVGRIKQFKMYLSSLPMTVRTVMVVSHGTFLRYMLPGRAPLMPNTGITTWLWPRRLTAHVRL